MIQVVATDAETVNVRCCIDPAWLPADQAAFESYPDSTPYSGKPSPKPLFFRGRPLLIGAPRSAALGGGMALDWRDRGETIHVHVGSDGDDRFVRAAVATRCLYLGFGGDDRVVVPDAAGESVHVSDSTSVPAAMANANPQRTLPNDRMVEADRSLSKVVPVSSGTTSIKPIIMEGN